LLTFHGLYATEHAWEGRRWLDKAMGWDLSDLQLKWAELIQHKTVLISSIRQLYNSCLKLNF